MRWVVCHLNNFSAVALVYIKFDYTLGAYTLSTAIGNKVDLVDFVLDRNS